VGLEVRFIPAGALELKARCGNLLCVVLAAAGRAFCNQGVAVFLQMILPVATVTTFIFIDRHELLLNHIF